MKTRKLFYVVFLEVFFIIYKKILKDYRINTVLMIPNSRPKNQINISQIFIACSTFILFVRRLMMLAVMTLDESKSIYWRALSLVLVSHTCICRYSLKSITQHKTYLKMWISSKSINCVLSPCVLAIGYLNRKSTSTILSVIIT